MSNRSSQQFLFLIFRSFFRHPAIQVLWIPSKTCTDVFSASTDGLVLWWDIRFPKKPTDKLVMDLDDPKRGNVYKATGITSLQFEQTMSSRFLAGTENGIVVNVNRRTDNPVEKLLVRFECYAGPVLAIDRNPVYTKNFLTVGNWSAKLWADDTKEGNLFSIRCVIFIHTYYHTYAILVIIITIIKFTYFSPGRAINFIFYILSFKNENRDQVFILFFSFISFID